MLYASINEFSIIQKTKTDLINASENPESLTNALKECKQNLNTLKEEVASMFEFRE